MNSLIITLSIMIGINLWLIPQISEHCPIKIPILLDWIFMLFTCPGIESILIFIDGMVHEWITSIEDEINIICVLKGITNLLSVSIMLKLNFFLYIMYELNLMLKFM